MGENLPGIYRKSLWEIYARSVALVTVLGLVAAGIIGGYDLVERFNPAWTLNASMQVKYTSNEAYTKFGAFHQGLSESEITRQRLKHYEELLRMERQNASQSLVKVGLGLAVILVLNLIVFGVERRRLRSSNR